MPSEMTAQAVAVAAGRMPETTAAVGKITGAETTETAAVTETVIETVTEIETGIATGNAVICRESCLRPGVTAAATPGRTPEDRIIPITPEEKPVAVRERNNCREQDAAFISCSILLFQCEKNNERYFLSKGFMLY